MTLAVANMQSGVSEEITEMTNTASRRGAQMRNAVANSAEGMYNAAADAASNMASHVAGSALQMQQQVIRAVSTTESTASSLVDSLHDDVIGKFSDMDTLAKQYWADVANYILDHPIQGDIYFTTHGGTTYQGGPGPGVVVKGGPGKNYGVGGNIQQNAAGTSYFPGGWSWVGERGPELMNVPRGAQIVPHNQSVGMGSPGGPIQLEVHVYRDKARMGQELVGPIVRAIRTATGAKF